MMMKNTRKKITHLRLNEAGDFRNQEEIRKWNYIASRLWNKHKIKTYTYTHRSDLDFSRAPFLVVNGSVPGIKGAARSYICKDRKTFDSMVLGRMSENVHLIVPNAICVLIGNSKEPYM